MNFLEWFDINNIEHLKAYKHLTKTGMWPNRFLPKDIKMNELWQVILASKMADKYVENKLRTE